MHYFFVPILILFLFTYTLYAQQDSKQASDIQKLVLKIKKAPATEKRVLINELKLKLREANEDTRAKTMENLKNTFAKNGSSMSGQGAQNKQGISAQGNMMMQMQHQGGQGGKPR